MKPGVGAHLEQRLAAPPTGPKPLTEGCTTQTQCGWISRQHTTQSQSCRPASCVRPRPKAADQVINGLPACEKPHLQLLSSPCAQSPAGPTVSLGGRQNTQQRGATGLGETACPGKTRPSRGLNHPIAALRAPRI